MYKFVLRYVVIYFILTITCYIVHSVNSKKNKKRDLSEKQRDSGRERCKRRNNNRAHRSGIDFADRT